MLRIPAALPQTASPQQLLVGGLQLTAAFFFFCLNIFAFKELKQRENASPSQISLCFLSFVMLILWKRRGSSRCQQALQLQWAVKHRATVSSSPQQERTDGSCSSPCHAEVAAGSPEGPSALLLV